MSALTPFLATQARPLARFIRLCLPLCLYADAACYTLMHIRMLVLMPRFIRLCFMLMLH